MSSRLSQSQSQNPVVGKRVLQSSFREWDKAKKGYITPKQLVNIMQQQEMPPDISLADMEELARFADTNSDGRISIDEYVAL